LDFEIEEAEQKNENLKKLHMTCMDGRSGQQHLLFIENDLQQEDVYNAYKEKRDVRPLDILMVRDGTYLVGTCAVR
jgi:hypothetical protein